MARAAAASEIPLISAVGHETDTTLIDFVSDMRAPTPTAAAELAVPVRMELLALTGELGGRLQRAVGHGVTRRRQRLSDLSSGLPRAETLVASAAQRLDLLGERLAPALRSLARLKRGGLDAAGASLRPGLLALRLQDRARRATDLAGRLSPALNRAVAEMRRRFNDVGRGLRSDGLRRSAISKRDALVATATRFRDMARGQTARWRTDLEGLERLRQTLGYEATLGRGYAVVWGDDAVVTTKAAAERAAALQIQFRDGRLKLGSRKGPKSKDNPPDQGSLF